jgi:hypothetical protein
MNASDHQIFVMGVHHSGTSIVAYLLLSLGLFGGDTDDFIRHPTNPLKYWERRDVVEINQRRLDSFHEAPEARDLPSWLGWGYNRSHGPSVREHAMGVVDAMSKSGETWFVKDPRLSLVAAEWFELVPRPVCVTVKRHPLQWADSIIRYAPTASVPTLLHAYEQYYSSIHGACLGRPSLVLDHRDVVSDPLEAARSLWQFLSELGVSISPLQSVPPLLRSPRPDQPRDEYYSETEISSARAALALWSGNVQGPPVRVPWMRRTSSAQPRDEAYVTLLTSDDVGYLMGAMALGSSIRGHDGSRDMVCMVLRDVPREWYPILQRVGWEVRAVVTIPEFWWGHPGCGRASVDQEVRWGRMMSKLHAWRMPYKRVVYMDADSVLTGEISARSGRFGAEAGRAHAYFNAGVMDIVPGVGTFEFLIKSGQASSHPTLYGNGVDCTEQALLNRAIGSDYRPLNVGRPDVPSSMSPLNFAVHWITNSCPKPWKTEGVPCHCDSLPYRYWKRMYDRVAENLLLPAPVPTRPTVWEIFLGLFKKEEDATRRYIHEYD